MPWSCTCPALLPCPCPPCPPLPALSSSALLSCPKLPALPLPHFLVGTYTACRPPSAGPASASLATSCRLSCLSLITSLGRLDPNAAITTLLHLLHHSGSSQPKPPPELVHRALRCLCDLVATAEGCQHIRQATDALIGEPDGLLAHHRFQRDEVLMALQQLSQLAKMFLSQHGNSSAAGECGRQATCLPYHDAYGIQQQCCR